MTLPVPAPPPTNAERRRPLGPRTTAALVGANALGIALYLWGAAHAWAIPAERAAGITVITGEPFIWAGFVLPVLTVFGVVDALWAFRALVPLPRLRDARVGLVVAAAWAVAIAFDFAHH